MRAVAAGCGPRGIGRWCWWICRRSVGRFGCGGLNGAGSCPSADCAIRSFIEQDTKAGPVRALLTSRAARWATTQVGRQGRPVDEVATELGCDWHTVNKEVARWGKALLEADTARVGQVEAVGVDKNRCSGRKGSGAPSSGTPRSLTWEADS